MWGTEADKPRAEGGRKEEAPAESNPAGGLEDLEGSDSKEEGAAGAGQAFPARPHTSIAEV